ncbi:hypothetical protein BCV70DRAFT_234434 [Testicularia cyperi]|uniref:Membrane-associated proteins in eicosanoid and glutathione metabolism n=1 Tax=Testicularia cyperi TaxID=1882483 RepID=A0A317XWG0_9BASI|nr:hypothetical protein BCV70DRAFT_234434 [Testicularia cyperi]
MSTLASSSFSSVPNYSLFSIPAMWLVSFLPHPYAVALSKGRFKNSSPRQMMADLLAKKDKTKLDQKIIRAESAQMNGFENLGFFAAAVVAANYAKVPSHELNTLTGGYIASRILFNFLYIFVESEAVAGLRSASFVGGVAMVFTLFIKAGLRLK